MLWAIDSAMVRIVGDGSGGEGIVQRVGVVLLHRGQPKGGRVVVPVRRWSVGLPMRDIMWSSILLRVFSSLLIASTSADIT